MAQPITAAAPRRWVEYCRDRDLTRPPPSLLSNSKLQTVQQGRVVGGRDEASVLCVSVYGVEGGSEWELMWSVGGHDMVLVKGLN